MRKILTEMFREILPAFSSRFTPNNKRSPIHNTNLWPTTKSSLSYLGAQGLFLVCRVEYLFHWFHLPSQWNGWSFFMEFSWPHYIFSILELTCIQLREREFYGLGLLVIGDFLWKGTMVLFINGVLYDFFILGNVFVLAAIWMEKNLHSLQNYLIFSLGKVINIVK